MPIDFTAINDPTANVAQINRFMQQTVDSVSALEGRRPVSKKAEERILAAGGGTATPPSFSEYIYALKYLPGSHSAGLNEAIAAAQPGGTIVVPQGLHDVTEQIVITKPVRIIGYGMGGLNAPTGGNYTYYDACTLRSGLKNASLISVQLPPSAYLGGVSFEDFAVEGNKFLGGATSGHCIEILGGTPSTVMRGISLRKVLCRKAFDWGLAIYDNSFAIETDFCQLFENGAGGFTMGRTALLGGCGQIWHKHLMSDLNPIAAQIQPNTGGLVLFHGGHLADGVVGLDIESGTLAQVACTGVNIEGNTLGVRVAGSAGHLFDKCQLSSYGFTGGTCTVDGDGVTVHRTSADPTTKFSSIWVGTFPFYIAGVAYVIDHVVDTNTLVLLAGSAAPAGAGQSYGITTKNVHVSGPTSQPQLMPVKFDCCEFDSTKLHDGTTPGEDIRIDANVKNVCITMPAELASVLSIVDNGDNTQYEIPDYHSHGKSFYKITGNAPRIDFEDTTPSAATPKKRVQATNGNLYFIANDGSSVMLLLEDNGTVVFSGSVTGVADLTGSGTAQFFQYLSRSGSSGADQYNNGGRTAAEWTLAVPGTAGHFSSDASAGDIVLKTENATRLLIQNQGGASAISIKGNKVGFGLKDPAEVVDVAGYVQATTGIKVSGTKVVGGQEAAIAQVSGTIFGGAASDQLTNASAATLNDLISKFNTLLVELNNHGLIA